MEGRRSRIVVTVYRPDRRGDRLGGVRSDRGADRGLDLLALPDPPRNLAQVPGRGQHPVGETRKLPAWDAGERSSRLLDAQLLLRAAYPWDSRHDSREYSSERTVVLLPQLPALPGLFAAAVSGGEDRYRRAGRGSAGSALSCVRG